MTRIRLGWEARIDQITVAILFLVIGFGLVFLGAVLDWTGWLTVPMIVIGIPFLLVVLLRLSGWRSLWWPHDLVVSGETISYETKMGDAFTISWADLAAVGVHSDHGINERFGLILVFFPKSADFAAKLTSPKILRLPRNGTFRVRIPRRAGITEAIAQAAPAAWQRVPATPWDALVAEPGVAPQVVPAPDTRPPAVVDVGRRTRWQAMVGEVVTVAASAGFLVIIFGQHESVAIRVIGAIFGIPFTLVAVGLVLSVPMTARRRYFVLDADGFAWDDPHGEPFMFGWPEITSVSVETSMSRPAPTAWTARRRLDSIVVHTRKQHMRVPVGDQPATVEQLADAVQRFAPQLWSGQSTRTAGRVQYK
ncbi:hypothetical protein [Amycolatopsis pithecellobii]|uniref:PH domain-containing protein n=1 Tax=Amycolatopsis pithecellobii TaxID=664692 RepID=A0A6N7Z9P1_9PSEU|nr:hypothetical protein [Amycolatopsis pithecellobii]MTD58457.1 hypothetical protein [Amycolatopsis pithecellobii]